MTAATATIAWDEREHPHFQQKPATPAMFILMPHPQPRTPSVAPRPRGPDQRKLSRAPLWIDCSSRAKPPIILMWSTVLDSGHGSRYGMIRSHPMLRKQSNRCLAVTIPDHIRTFCPYRYRSPAGHLALAYHRDLRVVKSLLFQLQGSLKCFSCQQQPYGHGISVRDTSRIRQGLLSISDLRYVHGKDVVDFEPDFFTRYRSAHLVGRLHERVVTLRSTTAVLHCIVQDQGETLQTSKC